MQNFSKSRIQITSDAAELFSILFLEEIVMGYTLPVVTRNTAIRFTSLSFISKGCAADLQAGLFFDINTGLILAIVWPPFLIAMVAPVTSKNLQLSLTS